jgi:regulatory protein YycI of two-component signal transduction system YycFG
MDWSKTKSILIIAFLLLDLFLGYQLWAGKTDKWEQAESAEWLLDDLNAQLKSRNITLAVKIPSENPEMHYLNVRYVYFSDEELKPLQVKNIKRGQTFIEVQFASPLSFETSELNEAMSERVPRFSQYQYDELMSTQTQLRFFQIYNELPLFGAQLDIALQNGKIVGYRQTMYEVQGQGSGRKVIPAVTALRALVENGYVQKGETIRAIDRGYFGHIYDADVQVLAPVWRVIHGDRVHYVNAITGAVEKQMNERGTL